MNVKNKSGVTIIVLVITIIVMLILFSVTFTASIELLRNSKRDRMETMLHIAQSRAEILFDDLMFENDEKSPSEIKKMLQDLDASDRSKLCSYVGGPLSTTDEINYVGYVDTSTTVYSSWSKTYLENQGIDTKNLAEGDTIIVKYDLEKEEVDVASTIGIVEKKVEKHTLKELLE